MALAWMVDCKTCQLRFAVKPRAPSSGKSMGAIPRKTSAGQFECPHCHDIHHYTKDDYIPGEGRIHS
jgi:hypothetical protein